METANDALHKVLSVGWTDAFWTVILDNKNSAFVAERTTADSLLSHIAELQTRQAEFCVGVAAGLERVLSAELDSCEVAAVDRWVLVVLADVLDSLMTTSPKLRMRGSFALRRCRAG